MQWFLQVNRNQMGERWLHFYEAITQPLEGQGKEPRPGDGVVSDFPPCHPPPQGHSPLSPPGHIPETAIPGKWGGCT